MAMGEGKQVRSRSARTQCHKSCISFVMTLILGIIFQVQQGVGVEPSGLLLKWVWDSASEVSFLLVALPTSGPRQLPPVLFTLKAWAAWPGNTWAPRWCPRAACSSYPRDRPDSLRVGGVAALGATLTGTVPAKPKTTPGTRRKSRFLGNFAAFVRELL